MAYSKTGSKPFEPASKAAHHYIINDPIVQDLMEKLWLPPPPDGPTLAGRVTQFIPDKNPGIERIIAIDGGYTEVVVRKAFPSALMHFFQFGALLVDCKELAILERSSFIAPEDMARMRSIERLKLALPTKQVRAKDCDTLSETVRKQIFEFFKRETLSEQSTLMDTLKWFVFHRYKPLASRTDEEKRWELSSHPIVKSLGSLVIDESILRDDGSFDCPRTGKTIYLTDIFRLHEVIDEETGAVGICGYLAGVIEHVMAIHVIRHLLINYPEALSKVLFMLDRPTGFFGQTARLHVLMSNLINWLFDNHDLLLVGIEKSGAFVDHAIQLRDVMPAGSFLLLDDGYIYKYISPGQEDPNRPYAVTSYYGHKLIFKARTNEMYVVSVPVRRLLKHPTVEDYPNLLRLLTMVENLRCDMYESGLLPIALANKLVSLSTQPSSQILKAFARDKIDGAGRI